MRSWIAPVLAVAGLFACAKSPAKFNLSFPHKDDQLIVSLRDAAAQARFLAEQPAAKTTRIEVLNDRTLLLHFESAAALEEQAEALAREKTVLAVEANLIYQLEAVVPNDPDFAKLYALQNKGQQGGLAGADIGIVNAWQEQTGNRRVLVGIIDSGADYQHPDLAANMWTNPGESGLDEAGQDKKSNGIDDDSNGLIDDWHGWDFFNNDNDPMDDNSHGTHVAGTIGAVGNNGIGIAGVNWNVSMVPIKVFSANGQASTDIIIRGIDYATQLGVRVTNNSWGGGAFSDALFASFQRADARGVLTIAAAGNEASNSDVAPHYPSNYELPSIISVASSNRFNRLSSFSNYGARNVMVAAPGEDIYSTIPGNSYGVKSGTSMAAPHVTGLAALIAAQFPQADATAIKRKTLLSAIPVAAFTDKVRYGLIAAASAIEIDAIPPAAIADLLLENAGIRALTLSWPEAGDDGELGRASQYELRLSQEPIDDEAGWEAAKLLFPAALIRKDGRVSATLQSFDYNASGFITARGIDNVGNQGALSPSKAFALQPIEVVWSNDNVSLESWLSLDAPWKLADMEQLSVLSDSPAGNYENGVHASAVSQEITLAQSDVILAIRSRWQFEANFDFAYIELSRDQGKSWVLVDTFAASSLAWENRSIPLNPFLADAASFRLRFRVESDYSVTGAGWDIDSIQLIGSKR